MWFQLDCIIFMLSHQSADWLWRSSPTYPQGTVDRDVEPSSTQYLYSFHRIMCYAL